MSRLVIYEGDEQRAEHELARAVVGLGRHPQNDIVLDDRTLSRFHARIEKRDEGFVVVDLGAQNGVHLNGDRIEREALLSSGDRIDLGRYTAVFHERTRPRSAPRPAVAATPPMAPTPVSPLPGVGKPAARAPAKPAPRPSIDDDLDLDIDIGGDLDGDLVGSLDLDLDQDFGHTHNEPPGFNEASQVEYTAPQPTLVLLFNGMEVSRHPFAEPGLVVG
ncbi:MAG TPA: FHA domain-containing protein, partial [Myxococcota bacterium]